LFQLLPPIFLSKYCLHNYIFVGGAIDNGFVVAKGAIGEICDNDLGLDAEILEEFRDALLFFLDLGLVFDKNDDADAVEFFPGGNSVEDTSLQLLSVSSG